jgi:hypothetical protein
LLLDDHIGLFEYAGRAELFGKRLALRHAPAGNDDFRALGDENFRRAQADAAGGARDYRNLAVKPSHIVFSFVKPSRP